ncbi:MAG: (2Fe-2S)-binding protein [Gammaproteobacteria bacterium]|nr:(2Fe-2S)-binding protein [Gammaproteobacteria bacterium]
MYKLSINGATYEADVEDDTPLLWVLRDTLGLTGTKFGCGKGLCGTCTVHLDGQAVRSCVLPVQAVGTRAVTTIEGLSVGGRLHPVQQAWIDEDVPQCGYCQPGQIMAAAAFLASNPSPSDEQVRASMTNLCRCGTYLRIERAIRRAARGGTAS